MDDIRPDITIPGAADGEQAYGPWNPGITSRLPERLLPLATILRGENVFTTVERARELRDFTGLAIEEIVAFRPERLVLHELLIRVTADFSVPAGARVEDLGINFRRMTGDIHRRLAPHLPGAAGEYARLRARLAELITAALAADLGAPGAVDAGAADARSRIARWLRGHRRTHPPAANGWEREERALRAWTARAQGFADPLERTACRALVKVVSAIRARHGRVWGDHALITALAADIACNETCSEALGRLMAPRIREAAAQLGYRLLPAQRAPVVMNTKGASASGKSTMRPLQRKIAEAAGVDWSDFAHISPDIWRKYLLDYGSLGAAYRYAGTLTGHELEIIDRKLDRYMASKAERGDMPHLLIDRFRFDSFAPDSDEAGSNLLTRFGRLIYLFFLITPPHATVERAWKRGLEVGRYKAVDDLLAHNVEAYTGMPELFFTWALRTGKDVHYEFLDNSVALGELPRTAAFGANGELHVLDVKCMLDIDRYRKININARGPGEVYPDARAMAPADNTRFLLQCARRLPALNFVDRATRRLYARLESGRLAWTDREHLALAMENDETRAGILAVAPGAPAFQPSGRIDPQALQAALEAARAHTIGQ
jgi:hypothetical protein